jgi:hypothetical protein
MIVFWAAITAGAELKTQTLAHQCSGQLRY